MCVCLCVIPQTHWCWCLGCGGHGGWELKDRLGWGGWRQSPEPCGVAACHHQWSEECCWTMLAGHGMAAWATHWLTETAGYDLRGCQSVQLNQRTEVLVKEWFIGVSAPLLKCTIKRFSTVTNKEALFFSSFLHIKYDKNNMSRKGYHHFLDWIKVRTSNQTRSLFDLSYRSKLDFTGCIFDLKWQLIFVLK